LSVKNEKENVSVIILNSIIKVRAIATVNRILLVHSDKSFIRKSFSRTLCS